jgi:hypothetical protein
MKVLDQVKQRCLKLHRKLSKVPDYAELSRLRKFVAEYEQLQRDAASPSKEGK